MKTINKLKRRRISNTEAGQPDTWRNVGRRLLIGARLLWPGIAKAVQDLNRTRGNRTPEEYLQFAAGADPDGAFFVLAGLAVENFLKARILDRKIDAGEAIPAEGKAIVKLFPGDGHDLVALAKRGDMPVSADVERLLWRLSEYVRWAGRYPISKRDAGPTAEKHEIRENDLLDIEAFIASTFRVK